MLSIVCGNHQFLFLPKCVESTLVNIDEICLLVNFLKPILNTKSIKWKLLFLNSEIKTTNLWMIQNKNGNLNFIIFIDLIGVGGGQIFVTSLNTKGLKYFSTNFDS